ncbi:MAG: hypothetical protein RL681_290 [Candidatus Parcubacteria bacterium]|jgi:hypothetical protein
MAEEVKLQLIKRAPPPPQLPMLGQVDPATTCFFGRSNYIAALEEKRYIFGIKREDRRRHMYVIGKSGVGKSKFLELLIRQDIAAGKGVCVIDPHGELIDDIMPFIPESRVNDVCLIDPSDREFAASFNPLANIDPEFKHQLTQGLIEVMKRQFAANWKPRLEHVFRFTCLALLDYPHATMRGMISMLTDRNYRQKVIEYIEDDMVKRFWAIEFADWSEKFDTTAIIPLVNKLGQFLSDPMLRNIFGQKENKIDFEVLMEKQKIVLVNLSKGKIGEENSSFFGSMFITKIKQAGMARAHIPSRERKDFYLYVDEFQNVVTETFQHLMSEARKYGLCLTLAHQYITQLIPTVRSAVMGNIGTLVVFRVGGEDAAKLEVEMTPIFKAKDMINLGRQEFYIKLMIDGEVYDPFSAETLKVMPPTHPDFSKRIIEASRRQYSMPTETVRNLIAEEESSIIRSASEKAAITGSARSSGGEKKAADTNDTPEPLI